MWRWLKQYSKLPLLFVLFAGVCQKHVKSLLVSWHLIFQPWSVWRYCVVQGQRILRREQEEHISVACILVFWSFQSQEHRWKSRLHFVEVGTPNLWPLQEEKFLARQLQHSGLQTRRQRLAAHTPESFSSFSFHLFKYFLIFFHSNQVVPETSSFTKMWMMRAALFFPLNSSLLHAWVYWESFCRTKLSNCSKLRIWYCSGRLCSGSISSAVGMLTISSFWVQRLRCTHGSLVSLRLSLRTNMFPRVSLPRVVLAPVSMVFSCMC